jgi:hypothetical protein
MSCQHRSIVGNSEGETCMDCGEVLAGYGHNMQSRNCDHTRSFREGIESICPYCYIEQEISNITPE